MIKIIYLDGKVEYQDIHRPLTYADLFLIFGSYTTMKYLYTTTTPSGKQVDFYVVYQGGLENEDGTFRLPLNEKVFEDYGVKAYGTAIVCKSDILDMEE